MITTQAVTRIVSTLVLLSTAGVLSAGPLNPPAGPIVSTNKTLQEVEPRIAINATNTPGDADALFKISQPGSYYLTGNITGVIGKNGIEIAAPGVTLDLNGFELAGVSGSLNGVYSTSSFTFAIRNGTVRGWGDDGVSVVGSNGATITDISAVGNGGYGIRGSNSSTIKHCVAFSNQGTGLRVTSGGVIDSCVSRQNGGSGIECGNSSLIISNSCYSNGAGAGGGAGISVLSINNRIEGNHCSSNFRGIGVSGTDNIIIRNTCTANGTNWDISAGNHYGPIIDRTAVSPPAVLGNAAADALGSTHPNANFTH